MDSKICAKCGAIKSLSEFRKRSKSSDGYQSYCKTCANQRNYQYIKGVGYEKRKKYQKTWANKNGRKCYRENRIRFRKNNPDKYKAHLAVGNAVTRGVLVRIGTLSCIYCGKQAEDYHHHKGYDKIHRLDVVPVCRKCHKNL